MRVNSILLLVALWCLVLEVRMVSSVETDSSSSSEHQLSAAKASNTRGRRRVQNEDEVEVEVSPSWFGGLANNFRTFLNNARAWCDDDALPDDSSNPNVPTEPPALPPTKCDNDDLPDDSANPDVPTEPPSPAPTNPVPAPTVPAPAPTNPVPAPTEPAPAPAPEPAPAPTPAPQYLGCWRDANDRAMEYTVGNGHGIYSCVGQCRVRGYAYAGIQFHDQCQCGNSYNKHGQTGESECNAACLYGSGMCGGSWRISVYATGIPAGPVPAPTLPPTLPPIQPPSPPPTRAPTPAPVSPFGITLGLDGVPAQYDYFSNAVSKWSTVIVGDLPDINGHLGGTSTCGAWPEAIDDVYICGKYKDIDGAGGVLGFAGPRHFRDNQVKKLPITGEMVFDMADVVRPSVNLLAVILHEMAHVLGIGSMWQLNGLSNGFTVPCNYNYNTAATREYQAITGCSNAVPLETSFTTGGSNCAHWQESCLGPEIMTPRASGSLPISRLTVAGLEDLGYQVNYGAAEPFSISCGCRRRGLRSNTTDPSFMELEDDYSSLDEAFDSSSRRRRLSEQGEQIAMDFGKNVLQENREAISLLPGSSDYPDLGGELIFVLYEEDGVIHNVLVTHES